jgi:hypothetical protein
VWRRAALAASFNAILICAVVLVIRSEPKFDGIGFLIPFRQWIAGYRINEDAKLRNALWSAGKYVPISSNSTNIKILFPLTNLYEIGSVEIPMARLDNAFRADQRRIYDGGRRRERIITRQFVVSKFVIDPNITSARRRVAAISPARTDSPEYVTALEITMRYPTKSTMMYVSPVAGDHCQFSDIGVVSGCFGPFFSGIGCFLSRIGSDLGIVQAFADENELPKEKGQLAYRNYNQPEREESYSLVRKPVPSGFVWLTFAGAIGSGLFFGGVGYLVYRFGGRRDETAPRSKPHYRPEKRPE